MQNTIEAVIPFVVIFLSAGALWVPFVVSAFAIGRKRLTIKTILAGTAVEAICLATAAWGWHQWTTLR
jgi:hypothetical protein